MSRRALLAAAGLVGAACSVGPRYSEPVPVGAGTVVRAPSARDSARTFFDSLAAARANDSVPVARTSAAHIRDDSAAAVAWREIFRDTALVRLVQTASAENRDLREAIARIREFRAEVGVARAFRLPSLDANGSVSTNRVPVDGAGPASYEAFRVTADVAWELDFWGRLRRGIDAARADVGAEEANERAVLLSLVSDVTTGYLQLLELDQERAIAERTLAARRQMFDLAQSRFRQGVISEVDVRRFEAEVAVPAAVLAQLEQLRVQQENRLNLLIGAVPGPIARGGSLIDAVAALEVPDSIPAAVLARRPDVRAAERDLAAATARVGIAQAARLPAVFVTGYYGTQAFRAGDLFSNRAETYQLQGGVSVPLFTGGRLSSQVEAARARAEQAQNRYEKAVLVALNDAGTALAGVRATRDQVVAQETQVLALRRARALADIRYRSGVASYIEVLDAERGLFSAELTLSQAQLQQLTAAVQLYRAIGGEWQR
jgi:multidrug efflux system outer membrane protein